MLALRVAGRLRRLSVNLGSVAKRRVCARARCLNRNAFKFCMVIAKRGVASTGSVDFENPATQLVEENEAMNYKLYYQYGLPSVSEQHEYDLFNDQVWYGRVGHELTFKMLGLSDDTKHCDVFLLRDYHNHRIIGANALKRVSCKLSTVLHSNTSNCNDDEKEFRYVIRRNTCIAPEVQGKGYGGVIRKFSKYLDELHVADYGLSVTDQQTQNVAIYNLQIRSGFQVVGKLDSLMFSSAAAMDADIDPYIARNYDMYTIVGNDESARDEFEHIVALHRQYLLKHRIIDLSAIPHGIDANYPLYVIRHRESARILCVFQPRVARIQVKAASKAQGIAVETVAKLLREPFRFEQDVNTVAIWALYMDDTEENEHSGDMAKCIKELIKYCMQRNGAPLALNVFHSNNPYAVYLRENKSAMFGMFELAYYEKENANILMRFQGLSEEQKNIISSNPVMIKCPVPTF